MDDFSGPAIAKQDRPIGLALPLRPLSQVEHELNAKFYEELSVQDAPVPFVNDDGSLENGEDYVKRFGRELNLDEAMTVRDLIEDELLNKFRLPLIISRELAGATLEEFRAACALENVNPII